MNSPQDHHITVRLHHEDGSTFLHDIDTHSPIYTLLQDSDKKVFVVYNGNILSQSFTFSFFGIPDNADLYLIRDERVDEKRGIPETSTNSDYFDRFCVLRFQTTGTNLSDPDSLKSIIDQLLDPSLAFEVARTQDVHLMNCESRRGMCLRLRKREYIQDSQFGKETCLPCNITTPSQSALPVTWKRTGSIH